jgi:aspartate/methionine/tyrosine aminotransferase
MRFPISQRMLNVQAPMIPVVGEMIKRHPGTISLGQGVVHYAPPPQVGRGGRPGRDGRPAGVPVRAGVRPRRAARRDPGQAGGENGVAVGPDRRVAVTSGSNMGFLNAVMAIADPGDEVILLSPFYFNHEMAIDIAGCRAVVVPTDADHQPRVDAIAAAVTPRTRAVVTISPNNPTGAVYPEATLRAINALCRDRGLYHLADEAYEYFTYGGTKPFSPASIPGSEPYTIGFYTLSKAYGMAGWRVGYMVMPAHLEESVKKVQDTNLICPPIVTQLAATAALAAGRAWCDQQTKHFGDVRSLVLGELATLGDRVRVPAPGGAFYALMRVDSARKTWTSSRP